MCYQDSYGSQDVLVELRKCGGTSLDEILVKIGAQRDQNMAHLLLWLLLT